ncbi:Motile sperm domain-containing protein 2 [Podila humilis]|nr:Motile sperm domain-containing protein 2 [Podila humilis]
MASATPSSAFLPGSTTTTTLQQPATAPPTILRISPQTFQFTASKVSSGLVSQIKIKNVLPTPVGYKFKTNAPLRYSVKPVLGVLAPGESIKVFVRCESWVNPQDRFLLQSVNLTEEESQYIDAATWKDLSRRRIIESFIQCSSSSTLAMRDPQDDGGSLSSTSSSSSTGSSGSYSTRSSSALSEKSRQLRAQHQSQKERRSAVPTSNSQGRKLSSSSTSSSASSSASASPGSYPTMFQAKQPSTKSIDTKQRNQEKSIQEQQSIPPAPLALFAAPIHYLHTKASNSKQTLRTLSKFLAVRQYTKMQVFTVSIVCLLLGLLFPMERLFVMFGSDHGLPVIGHKATAVPKAIFSGVSSSSSSSPLSQKPPAIVVPVPRSQQQQQQQQRSKVLVQVPPQEEEVPESLSSSMPFLPKVESLLPQKK